MSYNSNSDLPLGPGVLRGLTFCKKPGVGTRRLTRIQGLETETAVRSECLCESEKYWQVNSKVEKMPGLAKALNQGLGISWFCRGCRVP